MIMISGGQIKNHQFVPQQGTKPAYKQFNVKEKQNISKLNLPRNYTNYKYKLDGMWI